MTRPVIALRIGNSNKPYFYYIGHVFYYIKQPAAMHCGAADSDLSLSIFMFEPQSTLLKPALIFVGSGAGGLLRYSLGGFIQSWCGPHFPFGTLVVNVSGCFVMGFLATAWSGTVLIREEYRAAVLIGVLGGYTTFSSFGAETFVLVQNGGWWRAAGYVAGSVALSLLAVWTGAAIATRLCGAASS